MRKVTCTNLAGIGVSEMQLLVVMGMAKLHELNINKYEHGVTGTPIEIPDISQAEKARVISTALAEVVNE